MLKILEDTTWNIKIGLSAEMDCLKFECVFLEITNYEELLQITSNLDTIFISYLSGELYKIFWKIIVEISTSFQCLLEIILCTEKLAHPLKH